MLEKFQRVVVSPREIRKFIATTKRSFQCEGVTSDADKFHTNQAYTSYLTTTRYYMYFIYVFDPFI